MREENFLMHHLPSRGFISPEPTNVIQLPVIGYHKQDPSKMWVGYQSVKIITSGVKAYIGFKSETSQGV